MTKKQFLRVLRYAQDDKGRSVVKRAFQEKKWMYSDGQTVKPFQARHPDTKLGSRFALKETPAFPF
jgi:hypothetical protein